MDVILPYDLEEIIIEQMETGGFQSPEEVIRAGLFLLQGLSFRLDLAQSPEAALRAKLQAGIAQLDAGEDISGDEAKEDLLALAAGRRASILPG